VLLPVPHQPWFAQQVLCVRLLLGVLPQQHFLVLYQVLLRVLLDCSQMLVALWQMDDLPCVLESTAD
jgi:hypothetical protein